MRRVIVIQLGKGYCGEAKVDGFYESQVQRIEIDAEGGTFYLVMLPGFDLERLKEYPLRAHFQASFSRPGGNLGELKVSKPVAKY